MSLLRICPDFASGLNSSDRPAPVFTVIFSLISPTFPPINHFGITVNLRRYFCRNLNTASSMSSSQQLRNANTVNGEHPSPTTANTRCGPDKPSLGNNNIVAIRPTVVANSAGRGVDFSKVIGKVIDPIMHTKLTISRSRNLSTSVEP